MCIARELYIIPDITCVSEEMHSQNNDIKSPYDFEKFTFNINGHFIELFLLGHLLEDRIEILGVELIVREGNKAGGAVICEVDEYVVVGPTLDHLFAFVGQSPITLQHSEEHLRRHFFIDVIFRHCK